MWKQVQKGKKVVKDEFLRGSEHSSRTKAVGRDRMIMKMSFEVETVSEEHAAGS